ncbi:TadE/TadG family type IV pilus assembly protein [Rhodoblastus sp.]|uniref:TadE/TadG family type IV pilus assembly protein n=1 Tax=Rhodoblastus sp. TaxID=1962975 RepID=UPI002639FD63|nr:TadE/TadG family type IV pilus assembly protein [Rhodoblastus sp.]
MRLLALLKQADGAAAVEFAFVGPIFLVLLLAILQSGMMLWTQLGLEHAVESAARCSAVNGTICGTSSAVQTYAASQAYGLNLPSSTFSYSKSTCGNLVSGSYTYYFLTRAFGTASVPLSAQACFPSQS